MLSSQRKGQGWGKQGKAGKHTLWTKTHTHTHKQSSALEKSPFLADIFMESRWGIFLTEVASFLEQISPISASIDKSMIKKEGMASPTPPFISLDYIATEISENIVWQYNKFWEHWKNSSKKNHATREFSSQSLAKKRRNEVVEILGLLEGLGCERIKFLELKTLASTKHEKRRRRGEIMTDSQNERRQGNHGFLQEKSNK